MHDASQKNSGVDVGKMGERNCATRDVCGTGYAHTKSMGDEYERSARYIRVWGVTGAVFGDFEQEAIKAYVRERGRGRIESEDGVWRIF